MPTDPHFRSLVSSYSVCTFALTEFELTPHPEKKKKKVLKQAQLRAAKENAGEKNNPRKK